MAYMTRAQSTLEKGDGSLIKVFAEKKLSPAIPPIFQIDNTPSETVLEGHADDQPARKPHPGGRLLSPV